jgi:chemotaxis protein CheD
MTDNGANTVTVKMAEMGIATDSARLKTILGSCVGIILSDRDRRVSGLAHVMLPAKHRDDGATGKYADTAIPALVASLTVSGSRRASLRAFLIGGAQMFPMGNVKLASIGDQNVEAARRILAESRIPIVFEDIGGKVGRTVVFDNATGEVSVKTLQAIDRQGGAA